MTVNKLAEGVLYLTGGTHHSVAIEQKDHVVLVEAPQSEARAQAVIDKVKEVIPGKPIKPLAAYAKPPATPNPYAVNLQENIEKLKLDVEHIAALHGPGVAKLADLKAYNTPPAVVGSNP